MKMILPGLSLSARLASFAIIAVALLAACSHHPKNKEGKPYDANSARCIWKDGHLLRDRNAQLVDEHGYRDHFEQALDQQETDRRIAKDCESSDAYKNRRNKANIKAELDKALSKKGKLVK